MPKMDVYLNQTVKVADLGGLNEYGRQTVAGERNMKVRWQDVSKTIKGNKGEDLLVEAIMYVKPTETLTVGMKVYNNVSLPYRVLKVAEKRGLDGKVHHKEVFMQRVTP